MNGLREEMSAFRREKAETVERARQTAALFILAGVDLVEALGAAQPERRRIAARLERLIERERQRGIRRHWSYDLNRHIALKQALDQLSRQDAPHTKTAPIGAVLSYRERRAARRTPALG